MAAAGADAAQAADLIVVAGGGWTGDAGRPRAEAVAVRGERIVAVGSASEMERHRAAWTRVIRLPGGFLTPGFIDNHTHFNSAGALLLGANLLDVADAEGLRARVAEARDRLPAGAWILGGDWGAYEAWALGSAGDDAGAARRSSTRTAPSSTRSHRARRRSSGAGTAPRTWPTAPPSRRRAPRARGRAWSAGTAP
jgi:cytosine/adenosine deaminase-related metal-dependent hydrolase